MYCCLLTAFYVSLYDPMCLSSSILFFCFFCVPFCCLDAYLHIWTSVHFSTISLFLEIWISDAASVSPLYLVLHFHLELYSCSYILPFYLLNVLVYFSTARRLFFHSRSILTRYFFSYSSSPVLFYRFSCWLASVRWFSTVHRYLWHISIREIKWWPKNYYLFKYTEHDGHTFENNNDKIHICCVHAMHSVYCAACIEWRRPGETDRKEIS